MLYGNLIHRGSGFSQTSSVKGGQTKIALTFPPILDQFLVFIGTDISNEECNFLFHQGIVFGGLSMERDSVTS